MRSLVSKALPGRSRAVIDGITLTPLSIIPVEKGNVLHAINCAESGFSGFGEAYFSDVDYGAVKGWKKHNEMVSNIVVPVGEIKFVFYDDRVGSKTIHQYQEATLSRDTYMRITAEPGIWMAFQGAAQGHNMLLNIASIKHEPSESISVPIEQFDYSFGEL